MPGMKSKKPEKPEKKKLLGLKKDTLKKLTEDELQDVNGGQSCGSCWSRTQFYQDG